MLSARPTVTFQFPSQTPVPPPSPSKFFATMTFPIRSYVQNIHTKKVGQVYRTYTDTSQVLVQWYKSPKLDKLENHSRISEIDLRYYLRVNDKIERFWPDGKWYPARIVRAYDKNKKLKIYFYEEKNKDLQYQDGIERDLFKFGEEWRWPKKQHVELAASIPVKRKRSPDNTPPVAPPIDPRNSPVESPRRRVIRTGPRIKPPTHLGHIHYEANLMKCGQSPSEKDLLKNIIEGFTKHVHPLRKIYFELAQLTVHHNRLKISHEAQRKQIHDLSKSLEASKHLNTMSKNKNKQLKAENDDLQVRDKNRMAKFEKALSLRKDNETLKKQLSDSEKERGIETEKYKISLKEIYDDLVAVRRENDTLKKQISEISDSAKEKSVSLQKDNEALIKENDQKVLAYQTLKQEMESYKENARKCISEKKTEIIQKDKVIKETEHKLKAYQDYHHQEKDKMTKQIEELNKEITRMKERDERTKNFFSEHYS